MKKWDDASIFDRNPPKLTREKDGCRYYDRKRSQLLDYIILPAAPDGCLLWSSAIYREKMLPNRHHRRENASFLAIEHVLEGSMLFRQNGRMYLAEPGNICLMLPGMDSEFLVEPNGQCIKSSLLIEGRLLNETLIQSGLMECDILESVPQKRFETTLTLLEEISQHYIGNFQERIGILSFEVLQLLATRRDHTDFPEELSALLAYMESNIGENLTLENFAEYCSCSVSSLVRKFRTHLKCTPYQMLVKLRMRMAVRLLMEQQLLIKEIAETVGYQNALNFSTEFKKYHGQSPRKYRDKNSIV